MQSRLYLQLFLVASHFALKELLVANLTTIPTTRRYSTHLPLTLIKVLSIVVERSYINYIGFAADCLSHHRVKGSQTIKEVYSDL